MSPGIWILQQVPTLTYFPMGVVFFFFVVSILRFLTEEGPTYSVSYSGTWGEIPLFLIWTLGSIIVDEVPVPAILMNLWVNLGIAAIFIVAGSFLYFQPGGHKNFVDGLHNAVVVPVFGYMTTICMLLFLLTMHYLLVTVGIICLLTWGFFVRKDFRERRLDQAAHVEETCVRSIRGTTWIVRFLNAFGLAIVFFILAELLGPRLAMAFS